MPLRSKIAVPQFPGDRMVSHTMKLPLSWLRKLRALAAKRGRTMADDVMSVYAEHPTEPLEAPKYWEDHAPPKPRRGR